jgi:hypothetical protein
MKFHAVLSIFFLTNGRWVCYIKIVTFPGFFRSPLLKCVMRNWSSGLIGVVDWVELVYNFFLMSCRLYWRVFLRQRSGRLHYLPANKQHPRVIS